MGTGLWYLTISFPKVVLVRNTREIKCMNRELRYDFHAVAALLLFFKPTTKKNGIVLLHAPQVTGAL